MDEGEKRLKQEDCSEDSLGSGILTLTNKRLAFDKTRARMMDFSKHFGINRYPAVQIDNGKEFITIHMDKDFKTDNPM